MPTISDLQKLNSQFSDFADTGLMAKAIAGIAAMQSKAVDQMIRTFCTRNGIPLPGPELEGQELQKFVKEMHVKNVYWSGPRTLEDGSTVVSECFCWDMRRKDAVEPTYPFVRLVSKDNTFSVIILDDRPKEAR